MAQFSKKIISNLNNKFICKIDICQIKLVKKNYLRLQTFCLLGQKSLVKNFEFWIYGN